ncbi:ABC transporter permease [Natronomonas gomsonensis]|jgi:ABC-type dipeptide/oligopeptide/nickel transport system permease component|uniref:ABC transporter permease n=1 Tax=Natronomonas gomsonensis TaxID=1046043 RepID=UPI0020CA799C|nr:ABC transporter permease [Natronomonas gomsonensis]MCY4730905.1 ABC transporter permease [Natronomonas gomsonensis]
MSLRRYVVKRLLLTIPILLGVTAITFAMVHLQPGDVIDVLVGFNDVSAETERQLREQYNLDEPIYVQYVLWLRDAMVLDFGQSFISERSVGEAISTRLPYTVLLGILALFISIAIGVPAGIIAAVKKGEQADEVSRVAALLGVATPNFWLGLMLLLVFSVQLGWFRTIPPSDVAVYDPALLKFMVLPAITLGTASAALLMRIMRSSMLEELNKEYVKMARAKGLPERTVITKHVVRNSLISVVTVAALQIAFIVDGAVVIEQVFSVRGIGRLLLGAILQRDFPIIQASVLMIGVTIVFANLLADIIYSYLDPRIRY